MRYNIIAGIGGIGKGMLFHTDTDAPLGRSESRLAELSGAKDYCKLHIVFHYVAALLARQATVYPIGFVGRDAHGAELLEELGTGGMELTYVGADPSLPTMVSVCLQYPDKETCNFTASNSACTLVTPEYARRCMGRIGIGPSAIVAALPEVPLESRVQALRYGTEKGAYRVLSVPASEAGAFLDSGALKDCDLLAVNLEEAAALVRRIGEKCEARAPAAPPAQTANNIGIDVKTLSLGLFRHLSGLSPGAALLVTFGRGGAYTVSANRAEYVPCLPAEAVNTTGAGDAFLGGVIAGLAMGMPFQKGSSDAAFGATPLASAAELGAACAGMSVEASDTIAKNIDRRSVSKRIDRLGCGRREWFLND